MKRSIGITVIAVLSLIGSILMFGMGLMMIAVAVFAPKTDANLAPAFMAAMMGGNKHFLFSACGMGNFLEYRFIPSEKLGPDFNHRFLSVAGVNRRVLVAHGFHPASYRSQRSVC